MCSMIDGPKSWPLKNMALVAQPKATRSIDCYLSSMTRRWSPYHHRTMRQADHNLVWIKRQLKPSTILPHLAVKARIKQLRVVHTTFDGTWTVEQDTQDRSTDHEDVPRHAMTATYSDVTNLTTPGLKTANGLHRRYAVVWPNIEAPHTLFASQTK